MCLTYFSFIGKTGCKEYLFKDALSESNGLIALFTSFIRWINFCIRINTRELVCVTKSQSVLLQGNCMGSLSVSMWIFSSLKNVQNSTKRSVTGYEREGDCGPRLT